MPLPFISQGGTALVVNMITIGIILSLRRTT
jgi:cell division protein FtsW (lipid II flippase)